MGIKAKCKFDFDAIKALTHLMLFKRANPKKRMIAFSVISSILTLIIVLEMVIFSDANLVGLLCLTLLLYLFEFYLYFILPKFRFKSLAQMKETENEYLFCDNVIRILTNTAEYDGEAEIQYSFFVKVFETSRYFFLFQPNNQVFIVDKSTVTCGTVEDNRNKLLCYLKENYIICKY